MPAATPTAAALRHAAPIGAFPRGRFNGATRGFFDPAQSPTSKKGHLPSQICTCGKKCARGERAAFAQAPWRLTNDKGAKALPPFSQENHYDGYPKVSRVRAG